MKGNIINKNDEEEEEEEEEEEDDENPLDKFRKENKNKVFIFCLFSFFIEFISFL